MRTPGCGLFAAMCTPVVPGALPAALPGELPPVGGSQRDCGWIPLGPSDGRFARLLPCTVETCPPCWPCASGSGVPIGAVFGGEGIGAVFAGGDIAGRGGCGCPAIIVLAEAP